MRPASGMEWVDEPLWLDRLGIQRPALRRLGSYWDGLRRDRPMPARSDLEPWAIPDLLPSLYMWRVEAEARRFYLRLVGDRVNRLLGYWQRGAELAEAAPAHAVPVLRARYERVAFGPAVMRARGYVLLGRQHAVRVRAERLVLPLGIGATAEDLLGITWYEELPRTAAADSPDEVAESFLEIDDLEA